MPWISFCIATYKRPVFLETQLGHIEKQTFKDFEVIVSDNDPDRSAKQIVEKFDKRFKYFPNEENVGMVNSFNLSIKRSSGDYIIMITDDDYFVGVDRLDSFRAVFDKIPNQSIYIHCLRNGKSVNDIEVSTADDFAYQLLNPKITRDFLWSDSILRGDVVKQIGGIPNFGSPHLADHALLAYCGKDNGGVFINQSPLKMNGHENNFSKRNLDTYFYACSGFYGFMKANFTSSQLSKEEDVLDLHLSHWAVVSLTSLRAYYMKMKFKKEIGDIDALASKIYGLDFMKKHKKDYEIKSVLFYLTNLKKVMAYYFS